MNQVDGFLAELARGVLAAGGAGESDLPLALEQAREAWAELKRLGTDAFPCMVDLHDIRYVYQWDEEPPVIAVMVWDDQMWRNMAFVAVPAELL